jgi:hypothetical protein
MMITFLDDEFGEARAYKTGEEKSNEWKDRSGVRLSGEVGFL